MCTLSSSPLEWAARPLIGASPLVLLATMSAVTCSRQGQFGGCKHRSREKEREPEREREREREAEREQCGSRQGQASGLCTQR